MLYQLLVSIFLIFYQDSIPESALKKVKPFIEDPEMNIENVSLQNQIHILMLINYLLQEMF